MERIQKEFNESFWRYGKELYHATKTRTTLNIILRDGLKSDEFGARSVHGGNKEWKDVIFTVSEDGIELIKRYGSNIVSIDCKAMLKDNFKPLVTMDYDIAYMYAEAEYEGDEDFDEGDIRDIGQFPETVVIHTKHIPAKYISKITEDEMEELDIEELNHKEIKKESKKSLPSIFDEYVTSKISKDVFIKELKNADKFSSFIALEYKRLTPKHKSEIGDAIISHIRKFDKYEDYKNLLANK